jgi:AcrR family transcriptional regulator
MKKTQAKPRIKNPENTRIKLLQATVDLVAKKGADALEMKEVASTANVSRAVAYRHFADRDHLLREAKQWLSDRLLESVTEPQSNSLEDQIYEAAKLVLGNREASRLWVADALDGKAHDPDHPLYKTLIQSLEHLKVSNKARSDIDVEVLTSIMLGVVATLIIHGQQQKKNADIDDVARRFSAEWTRILSRGLFIDGEQPAAKKSSAAVKRRAPSPRKTRK